MWHKWLRSPALCQATPVTESEPWLDSDALLRAQKCVFVVAVHDSPWQNVGIILQWALKSIGSGAPKSHWDTAAVSYDISYDNIVWAEPWALILIVSWDKIESRHHSWEIWSAHALRKPWKPENNSTNLSRCPKRRRSIFHVFRRVCNSADGSLWDNCWAHHHLFSSGCASCPHWKTK